VIQNSKRHTKPLKPAPIRGYRKWRLGETLDLLYVHMAV